MSVIKEVFTVGLTTSGLFLIFYFTYYLCTGAWVVTNQLDFLFCYLILLMIVFFIKRERDW